MSDWLSHRGRRRALRGVAFAAGFLVWALLPLNVLVRGIVLMLACAVLCLYLVRTTPVPHQPDPDP
jgi:hypothetical protein